MKRKQLISLTSALAICCSMVSLPTASTSASTSDLIINEVCSQNKESLTDSYGKHSDWIELYNSSNLDVDISGYYISDDADEPLKFAFAENTVIKAQEYLVIFASDNPSTDSEIHTGFSLSKNGETVILSDSNGDKIQKLTIPTLGEDSTYGMTSSGVYEIMTATPGEKNNNVLSAPTFSATSGFYDSEFNLELNTNSDAEIYYTLDGSDPTSSNTAVKYTSAIAIKDRTNEENIYSKYEENESSNVSISRGNGYKSPNYKVDKATVVRAVAKDENGEYSSVVDNTYFVTNGNLSQYKDYTVVSLVTNPDNLFDPDTGIYVTGNQYLDWYNSSEYDSTKSVWDTDNISNFFSKGADWEREADITIFEQGTTSYQQNMGIRIKGASTRNSPQKSFNIFARSQYGSSKIEQAILPNNSDINGDLIDKYDSLSIRSVPEDTRLRDMFAEELLQDRTNLTTASMKPCVLFLNGEYWGMYVITEKISDYFIESNYGIPKENVAVIKANEIEDGDQSECDEYLSFMKKYSKLDLTDEENYKAVCDYIDIDSMIEHYAAGIYLGTWDWPNYNYGVWRNTGDYIEGNEYSDGKWRFITYDMDYTMGATYEDFGGVEGYAYNSFEHLENGKNAAPTNLFLALLKNDTFKKKFAKVYYEYADSVMATDKVNAQITKYSNSYTDLVANSTARWWGFYGGTKDSNVSWNKYKFQNTTLSSIKTYFANRAQYTLEDMEEYLGVDRTVLESDVQGDVDSDGDLDIADVVALQKWILKNKVDIDKNASDLNSDEKINVVDLTLLKQNLEK